MINNRVHRRTFLQGASILAIAAPAMPQFGGLAKKLGGTVTGDKGTSLPMPAGSFIAYIALATDLGIAGLQKMLELYPPEKIASIKEKCEKYNELQKASKPEEIDQSRFELASQAGDEVAKLETVVAALDEGKTKALRAAHTKLSLSVAADGFAGLYFKNYLDSLENEVKGAAANPMQASSLPAMKGQLATLTIAAKAVPTQLNSFTKVNGIAKKIADAQKIKLSDDPSPESVKSLDQLKQQGKATDV